MYITVHFATFSGNFQFLLIVMNRSKAGLMQMQIDQNGQEKIRQNPAQKYKDDVAAQSHSFSSIVLNLGRSSCDVITRLRLQCSS
jgi:hypothetical protein